MGVGVGGDVKNEEPPPLPSPWVQGEGERGTVRRENAATVFMSAIAKSERNPMAATAPSPARLDSLTLGKKASLYL